MIEARLTIRVIRNSDNNLFYTEKRDLKCDKKEFNPIISYTTRQFYEQYNPVVKINEATGKPMPEYSVYIDSEIISA